MKKTAKGKVAQEKSPELVSVTLTRTYNHDGVRFVRGLSYDVTGEYAEFLKSKGVI